MDKSKTEIVLVIDKSGSMSCLRQTVIESVNAFLKDQKDCEGSATVTMYAFDDEVMVMQECSPLENVPELSRENYEPDGCTALLDAVGTAIDDTGKRLAAMPEEQRPANVIIGIMTDGFENSSRRYKWKDIADRIAHQREKYSWRFMFFGAGMDAIEVASKMNIDRADSVTWDAGDANEVHAVMSSQSRRAKACRKVSMGTASYAVRQDACRSLSALMDEERERIKKDKKARK